MQSGFLALAVVFLALSERPRRRRAATSSRPSSSSSDDDALSQYGRSLGSVEVPSGGVARSVSPPVRTPVRDVEQIDVSRPRGVSADELPRQPPMDDELAAQGRLLGAVQVSRPSSSSSSSSSSRPSSSSSAPVRDVEAPGGRRVPEDTGIVPASSSNVSAEARRAAAQSIYRIATTTAASSRGAYRDRIREAQRVLGITADGLIGAESARAVYAAIGLRIPGISF